MASDPSTNEQSASTVAPEGGGLVGVFFSSWLKAFKSRGAIVVIGSIVAIAFVCLMARNIRWEAAASAFGHAIWLPWLPLAVLTYVAGMFLRGLRLQLLVRDESTISIGTASNIIAVGYAVNNIFPARLGEFARAGMLAERTGLPYLLALTITFLERLLDGLVILFLFVSASLIVPATPMMRSWAALAGLVFAFAMLSVSLITLVPQTSVALASNMTSNLDRRWHSRILALITQINRGFGCLRNGRSALLILMSSFAVWIVEALFFMLIMPCFGMPLGFIRAIITMSVTNLGILLPSSPGHVGTYHYTCQLALQTVCSIPGVTPGTLEPLNIDPSVAFSYAVIVHLVFYVTVTVWGLFAMVRYSLELGSNAALAWEAKPIKRLPDSDHESVSVITTYPEITPKVVESVTKFWSGLCECFVPEEHIVPDKEVFQRIMTDASTFTVTQLERLPFRLRVLFSVGVFGFKTLTILANGKFLCDMPLAKRRAYIHAWAFGGIALNRTFMKPIRSLALFAYYEQPEVKELLDEKSAAAVQPAPQAVTVKDELAAAKESEGITS